MLHKQLVSKASTAIFPSENDFGSVFAVGLGGCGHWEAAKPDSVAC